MQERVQKILAHAGVASRRQAEKLIEAGRVTVNGTLCRLGDTADPATDEILLDGSPVSAPEAPVYILLHKPRGYVTTARDERGRDTVLDLLDLEARVYPVGRLDMDSEGLLILTNDGDLANRLLHPAGEVDKVYEVCMTGVTDRGLRELQKPMDIDGYRIRPAGVRLLDRDGAWARLEITIHEGRNRQIRKMAETCGMRVTRLKRIAEGPILLGDLPRGQWRYLTEEEVRTLKNL